MAPVVRTSAPTRIVTVVAGLSLAVGTAGCLGGSATASSEHRPVARAIPAIGNASNLSAEPIIRADKSRPPNKLLTKDLVRGSGTKATVTSTVSVKYVGADYRNGKVFTSSTWTTGKAATFSLTRVVPGFAEGIAGMKVGGRREIVIPPALGYGSTASGPIQKNETLVFVVDLKAVSG